MTLLRPADRQHTTDRRLHALDGLRFVAASAVVLYHFTGVRTDYWGAAPSVVFPGLNEVTRYGFLGVEVFFVISGFAIMLSAAGRPLTAFVGSRVGRLFPAYWVAILLTAALQALWAGGRTPSTTDTAMNLTMVQDVFGATSVQVVFWTLLVELKFYLLVGLLMMVGITRVRLVAFAVLWPVVGELAAQNGAGLLTDVLVPDYAPYFGVGILLFLLARDGDDVAVWLALAFDLVLSVRLVDRYAPHASELTGTHVSGAVSVTVLLVAVAVVWLSTCGPLARLPWPWLSALGALTYPLYLVHSQFGYLVIDTLHDDLAPWVVLTLAVALGGVLAVAIRRWVERQAGPRLRRAVERGLTRPASPPATDRRARLSNN